MYIPPVINSNDKLNAALHHTCFNAQRKEARSCAVKKSTFLCIV